MKIWITPQRIIATLFAVFLGLAMFFSIRIAEANRQAESDFSEGWVLKSGEIVDLDDMDTGDTGGTLVVTKQLPDRLDYDDALCFAGANTNFTVFVNGHLEYRYDQKPNLTGNGYGVA